MKRAYFFVVLCFSMFMFFNAVSASTLYDSNGFESFNLGDLSGQDGWTATGGGAGGMIPQVVQSPNPVIGNKAVRLEIGDTQGDASSMDHAIPSMTVNNQTIVTVSFDIYRQGGHWPQNLWWWWWDNGEPTYGLQWDHYGEVSETLPNGWNPGAGSALTVLDRYADIEMVWDFTTGKAYSWYDGALVDNGIPITNVNTLSGWTILFGHDSATGTGSDVAWIDNFAITSSVVAPIPEPATMILLGSGLIGLVGYGRRKFFKK